MRFVKWEITHACNLRCSHCLVGDLLGPADLDLSFDGVCRVLDEVASLGATHLAILGGEPLVRKDIIPIIKYAVERGLSVSMVSNGIGINEHILIKLSDAGLSELTISIDGATEEVYDPVRGSGQFKRLLKSLESGFGTSGEHALPIQLCVNTVLEKGNTTKESLEAFFSLLSRFPVSLWRLLSLCNEGVAKETYANRALSTVERITFSRLLAESMEARRPRFKIDPQYIAPLVWHYLRVTGTNLPWPQLCCDAASDMLFIDGKGMAHSCDRTRQLPNARKTSLYNPADLRSLSALDVVESPQNKAFYQFLADFYADPAYEPCKRCYYNSTRRCEPCALFTLEGDSHPYQACLYVAELLEKQGVSISEPLSLPDIPPRHSTNAVQCEPVEPSPHELGSVPRVADNVLVALEGDSCLLYMGTTHTSYRLSGFAAAVVLSIDGRRKIDDICKLLGSIDPGGVSSKLFYRKAAGSILALSSCGLITTTPRQEVLPFSGKGSAVSVQSAPIL